MNSSPTRVKNGLGRRRVPVRDPRRRGRDAHPERRRLRAGGLRAPSSRVRAVERVTGAVIDLDRARCGFGYRDSVFKREDAGRFVITRVRFALRPGGAPSVRYAELAKKLAGHPSPTLAELREVVIALRRGKSMVLDPATRKRKSAGSFFTNPTLDGAAAATVAGAGGRLRGALPGRGDAEVPGLRRAGEALGGVVDRARRLSEGVARGVGGDLDEALAGAGEPWRCAGSRHPWRSRAGCVTGCVRRSA